MKATTTYNTNPLKKANMKRFYLKKYISFLSVFTAFLISTQNINAQTVVYSQDFDAATVVTYTANTVVDIDVTDGNNIVGNTAASQVTSIYCLNKSSAGIGINDATYPGIFRAYVNNNMPWSIVKTTDFSATAPTILQIEFDLWWDILSSSSGAGIEFAIGNGFSESITTTNPADGDVHSGFTIDNSSTSRVCEYGRYGSSYDYNSTGVTQETSQTYTWIINNSGSDFDYDDPAGGTQTLANDTWDLWIGTTLWVDGVAATTGAIDMQNLYIGSWANKKHEARIDNFVVTDLTASAGSASPTLAAAGSQTVDDDFDITFTDDATWRAAVTGITVDGTPYTSADYTLTAASLVLSTADITELQTAGSHEIIVLATGYTDADVTQTNIAGADHHLSITTEPTAPAVNGGALGTTSVVEILDQYNNLTTSTANITAAVGAGTWTIGGTVTVAASAGSASFSTLTATAAGSVTGATITYSSGALTDDTSSTFDIPAPASAPTVTTTAASNETDTGADSGGNVTNDGGASVTARGVVYSTSANPTTGDSYTTDGTGTGAFSSTISGLSASTTYYYRAYATNGVGTSYGSESSFTTAAAPTTVAYTYVWKTGQTACESGEDQSSNVTDLEPEITITGDGSYSTNSSLNITAAAEVITFTTTKDIDEICFYGKIEMASIDYSYDNSSWTTLNSTDTGNDATYTFTSIPAGTKTFYLKQTLTGGLYLRNSTFTLKNCTPGEPTTEPSGTPSFSSTTETSTTWGTFTDDASANTTVIFCRAGSAAGDPTDDVTYTANTVFGSGTQIGTTGWYCVYSGAASGTSVTVTGLTGTTAYYFKAYSLNECGADLDYYTGATLDGNTTTTGCIAPSGQATGSPTFSSTTTTATTWGTITQAATADNTVIFCREGASAAGDPADATTYSASTDWSSKGTQIGTTGWYCVYAGTAGSPSVTMSNLSEGTAYYFKAYSYNDCSSSPLYYTTSPIAGNTTTCTTPTTQVGAVSFASVADTQMDVDVASDGNGDKILIIAHSGGAVDTDPSDGTTYTANTAFGSGTLIGTGNYVVYAGVAASLPVTVTGLTASTTYHFAAYAYNDCGSDPQYKSADEETGSQATSATPASTCTEIDATTSVVGDWQTTYESGNAGEFSVDLVGDYLTNTTLCNVTGQDVARIDASGSEWLEVYVPAGFPTIESATFNISGNSSGTSDYINIIACCDETPFNTSKVTDTLEVHFTGYDQACVDREVTFPTGTKSFRMYRRVAWTEGSPYSTVGSGTNIGTGQTNRIGYMEVCVLGACNEPSTQVGAVSFPAAGESQLGLDLASFGDGDSIIVLAHNGAAVDANPVSSTTYDDDLTFGNGDEIGSGNFVVFKGDAGDFPISITGLSASTTYHFAAYAYQGCPGDPQYKTDDDGEVGSEATIAACDPPTSAPQGSPTFTSTTTTSTTWGSFSDAADADATIVFIRESSSAVGVPADGTTYTASTDWDSKGTQIGTTGWYCIYNGSASSASINLSNLSTGTYYYVKAYSYNSCGGFPEYYSGDNIGDNEQTIIQTCTYIPSAANSGTSYDYGDYTMYFSSTATSYTSASVSTSTSNTCGTADERYYMKNLVVYLENTAASEIILQGQQDYDVDITSVYTSSTLGGTYTAVGSFTNNGYSGSSCGTLGISNVSLSQGTYVLLSFGGSDEFRLSGICITVAPDEQEPTLTFDPANSATGVLLDAELTITANEALYLYDPSGPSFTELTTATLAGMSDGDISDYMVLVDVAANDTLDATYSIDGTGTIITVVPDAEFTYSKQYKLSIRNFADANDNFSASTQYAQFTARPTPAPEIKIELVSTDANVADDGDVNMGTVIGGTTIDKTFRIINTALLDDLNFTGVSAFTTGTKYAFVGDDPYDNTPLAAGDTVEFTVRFTPGVTAGTYTDILTISTNDPDEATFTINLSGGKAAFVLPYRYESALTSPVYTTEALYQDYTNLSDIPGEITLNGNSAIVEDVNYYEAYNVFQVEGNCMPAGSSALRVGRNLGDYDNGLEIDLVDGCGQVTVKWCSNGYRKIRISDDAANTYEQSASFLPGGICYTTSTVINTEDDIDLNIEFLGPDTALLSTIYYLEITPYDPELKSSAKNILSFSTDATTEDVRIYDDAIFISVDAGADLADITPDAITVSPFASVSPAQDIAQDFSSGAVVYTVTAQDGTTKDYDVFVEFETTYTGDYENTIEVEVDMNETDQILEVLEISNSACVVPVTGNGGNYVIHFLNGDDVPDGGYQIGGLSEVCIGSTVCYSLTNAPETNNPSYNWKIFGDNVSVFTLVGATGTLDTSGTTDTLTVNESLEELCMQAPDEITTAELEIVIQVRFDPLCSEAEGSSDFEINVTEDAPPAVTALEASCVNNGLLTVTANGAGAGATTYNWTLNPTKTIVSQTDSTVVLNVGTTDLDLAAAVVVQNGCGVTPATGEIDIDYATQTSTWNGSVNGDWNDPDNWNGRVPTACTNVIIPDVNVGSVAYPTISTTGTCNYITFQPGGAIKGIDKLTYAKAFVKISCERDHWYTLTAPLKEMYSGDYYFNGAPEAYMKLFNTTSPDAFGPDITYEGKFTRAFRSLDVDLTPGSGFAFKVSEKTWDYPNGSSNTSTDKAITFPRMNNDSSLLTSYVPYSSFSGMPYTFVTSTVTKTADAYRFAMEEADSSWVDIDITLDAGLSLIGNPMMTHLDIDQFLTDNTSTLTEEIYVWNGSSYQTYSSGDWDIPGGHYIAPMQSFVVNSAAGGDITFDISAHFDADDNSSALRATEAIKEEMLFVKATKDGKTTGTVITNNNKAYNNFDGRDIFKLFTPLTEVADIYSMSEGYALAFNKFNEYPYTTPLGIKTDQYGKVKLNFQGAESFADVNVYLINSFTGEKVNLKETADYEVDLTDENAKGTLFVEFRKAEVVKDNTITTSSSDDVQVFTKNNNTIRVISSPSNPIKDVTIMDEVGRILIRSKNLDVNLYDRTLNSGSKVVLVRVVTENSVKMVKVLIK